MESQNTSAFEAFFVAQQHFKVAIKDSLNPHFKSKFADFASVWDAVNVALHANGLFVTQPIRITDTGHAVVETIIRYKDGTVVEQSQCPVICKVQNDPQAMGSAITYARRYSLAATLCVVTDDDDAEAAASRSDNNQTSQRSAPAQGNNNSPDLTDWQVKIDSCADASDLNRTKKDIAGAKLDNDSFKTVWGALSKRAKHLGCAYDKTAKKFN